MKDNKKRSKVGLIISVFAVIIASISFVYSRIKGMSSWAEFTILVCVIIIFFSNISNYTLQKNKDTNKPN
jgi:amino acid permease